MPTVTPTANVEIEVEDVSSEEDKLAAAAAETIKAAGQHRKQLVNLLYYFSTFISFQTILKNSQRLSPKLKGFPNSKYNFSDQLGLQTSHCICLQLIWLFF